MRTLPYFPPSHPVSIACSHAARMRMMLNRLEVLLSVLAITTEDDNSQAILEAALAEIRETNAPEQIKVALDVLVEGLQ